MIPKHAPGPWTSRRHPGQGFEILDADGHPVMRQRGGLVPTVPDAQLMTQSAALAGALRRLCDRVEAIELEDGSTPDTLEARSILATIEPPDPIYTDCEFVQINPHEWHCTTHNRTRIGSQQEPVSCGIVAEEGS
jgi:hypothetical protein